MTATTCAVATYAVLGLLVMLTLWNEGRPVGASDIARVEWAALGGVVVGGLVGGLARKLDARIPLSAMGVLCAIEIAHLGMSSGLNGVLEGDRDLPPVLWLFVVGFKSAAVLVLFGALFWAIVGASTVVAINQGAAPPFEQEAYAMGIVTRAPPPMWRALWVGVGFLSLQELLIRWSPLATVGALVLAFAAARQLQRDHGRQALAVLLAGLFLLATAALMRATHASPRSPTDLCLSTCGKQVALHCADGPFSDGECEAACKKPMVELPACASLYEEHLRCLDALPSSAWACNREQRAIVVRAECTSTAAAMNKCRASHDLSDGYP